MPKSQQECDQLRRDYQATAREYQAKSAEAARLANDIDRPGNLAKAATKLHEADVLRQRMMRISDQIQKDCQ